VFLSRKHGSPESSGTTHLRCAERKKQTSLKDEGEIEEFTDKEKERTLVAVARPYKKCYREPIG
jgi:hypothetical protein